MATERRTLGEAARVTRQGADVKQERIVKAAKPVFLKYGYKRVTMGDLANAAGMSRPALYLVFAKKEDVFRGVIRQMAGEIADEVHARVGTIRSPLEKLKLVCEVWMVRTFDWSSQSQEARDIFESSHEFAQDAVADSMRLFERDLASVIALFPKGTVPKGVSAEQAAHLIAGGIVGIKKTCANSSELRGKIEALISLMLRPRARR